MDYQLKLNLFLEKYQFETKTGAQKHVTNLLHTLPKYTPLYDPILYDITKLHYFHYLFSPDYFTIEKTPFNNYCFHFHPKNNFFSEISISKIFSANPKKINIEQTFRSLIENQIRTFRRQQFSNVSLLSCSYSELALYNNADTRVYHHFIYRTLKELITYFIQLHNWAEGNLSNEQIGNKRYFKNNTINENWKIFHQLNAILQLIHKEVTSIL